MFVKVKSIALKGLETIGVDVEVNVSNRGLPRFDIVGLPNKAVEESRQRIKTAFQNFDIKFPNKRITVNLAPADVQKEGSFYDLPIAVGILAGVRGLSVPEKSLFFGEISLNGKLRHTKGSLLLSLYAKEHKFEQVFVPLDCTEEASSVPNVSVYGVPDLGKINEFLEAGSGLVIRDSVKNSKRDSEQHTYSEYVFENIIGQSQVKRSLEICASGGHNIIMMGSPGSGKSYLAKCLPSIMPALNREESLEVTKIYSSLGKIAPNQGLITQRPYRAPHHTISYSGMIGGGNLPKPGEISLAHRGILFMDEFNEFNRNVLESLRQPLEDGFLTVSRSRGSISFPANFILVASANPCPCGFRLDPYKRCTCSARIISQYQKKLSGPILDRIDLHVVVRPVDTTKSAVLKASRDANSSKEVKKRVEFARKTQLERFKSDLIFTNSEMGNTLIAKYCKLDSQTQLLMTQASSKLRLSMRSYNKVLKISRTIADLDGSDSIKEPHLAEALQYRSRLNQANG